MTPDEIAALHARLDKFEATCNDKFAKIDRWGYLIVGLLLGTGALSLSQFMGV